MTSESVLDLANLIRAKADVIAEATVEEDMVTALDHIEAATSRMRAIF